MSSPVQVPADVERDDTLIGRLTARQLAVLGVTAAAVYGLWQLFGPTRLVAFAAAALPIALVGILLALGRRDGLPLDRLLWAGLRQRITLRALPRTRHSRRAPAAGGRAESGQLVAAELPLRGVRGVGADRLGVADLGGFGSAVVCAVTPVNLSLRSPAEQDAVIAGFARWLHAQPGPVQILSRTRPLDLTRTADRLRQAAPRLGHPALARAAAAHAQHLQVLDRQAQLLHREFLIVFRDPTPTHRGHGAEALRRRATDAAALLGPLGLRVTPLDAPTAAATLRRATAPTTTVRPPGPRSRVGGSRDRGPAGVAGGMDAPTVELPVVLPWAPDPPRPGGGDDIDHETDPGSVGGRR